MIDILGPEGLKQLKEFSKTPSLLGFDFDGTLAPIVPRPEDVVFPDSTRTLLKELCGTRSVAVISGRKLSHLEGFLKFTHTDLYLVGNHGLESPWISEAQKKDFREKCDLWSKSIEEMGLLLKDIVFIEDKEVSLSLHIRNQKYWDHSLEKLKTLKPAPRLVLGKEVVNILPSSEIHKGASLIKLLDHLKLCRSIYIGDDVTDEDIFRLPSEMVFSIRVGESQTSAARYLLKERSDIDLLMKKILDLSKGY